MGLDGVHPAQAATVPPRAQTAPVFIGSEVYRGSSYGAWHPLRIPRVSTVMDLIRALGWLNPGQYRTSPRAKPNALHIWHDPAYVSALQAAEAAGSVSQTTREKHGLGTTANPVFPQMFRRPATSAGGTMLAAELVADGGVVHVPGGGTHHAMPDRANGFCYLNDPVLCLLRLRAQGLRRIAYVDIDAHHCDGVAYGFHGAPDVRMFSVHEERRWPFTGAIDDTAGGAAVNLPVPRGLNDTEMRTIAARLILPRLADWGPDAIVLQCGADMVLEDPLSRLALSNNAHFDLIRALRPLTPRLIVLGGGGYNPWTVARLWSGVWGVLNDRPMPAVLPQAAQNILRALSFPGNRLGKNPPEHWFTTLQDAPREGPVRHEITARLTQLGA